MHPGYEYDSDYFLNGVRTGKSLYDNYRWIPQLTIPMAQAIAKHLRAEATDSFLDFGCARGYIVKALKLLGYPVKGFDISPWALQNCDPEVADDIREELPVEGADWIIAKDVLEHIEPSELQSQIFKLVSLARKGVFIVVPLAERVVIAGGAVRRYIVPEYEKDVTHKIRRTYNEWLDFLLKSANDKIIVEGTVRVVGVKDKYFDTHPLGNGFFTLRKF